MRRMILLSMAGHVVLLVIAIALNAVRPGRAAVGPAVSYVHLVNLPPPPIAHPSLAPLPRPADPMKTVALPPMAPPPSLQDWWRRQMARVPMPSQTPAVPPVTPRPHSDASETERRPGAMTPAMTTAVSVEGPVFPFPSYLAAIQRSVTGHWTPPHLGVAGGPGPRDDRQVVVGFLLARTGQMSRLVVEHGSGERAQDEAALRAVILAQPFPPIPDELHQPSLQVHFRFTLRSGLTVGSGANE